MRTTSQPRKPFKPIKYVFLLPALIWVLSFTVFPLFYSLILSTTNTLLGRKDPAFIGLQNYANILCIEGTAGLVGLEKLSCEPRLGEIVMLTAFFTVFSTFLTLLFGTAIAWLFNHDLRGLRQFRAILTMPLFAAPIALGYLGVIIFNETAGPVNNTLQFFGLQKVDWITGVWPARFAILITDVWQWTPFVFIIILAAMQGIPEELNEAARIDTRSGWAIFRFITFPLIAPALGTVALLRLVETIKVLDIPFTLTAGGPGAATQTYSFFAYLNGLRSPFRQGYTSALAYVVVIVAIIISSIYFRRVRARFE